MSATVSATGSGCCRGRGGVGTPPDAAQHRAMVLRPARRRRTGGVGPLLGVRRRLRPRRRQPSLCRPAGRVRRCWTGWIRWCASRWSPPSRSPVMPATGCWRRSASSPRSSSPPPAAIDAVRDRHARYFADQAVAHCDLWDGPGHRVGDRLGGCRVRQPARRVPMGRRPGRPRHRRRHRRPHHHLGLRAAALRIGRVGRRDPRRRHRRRRASTPPPLHRRRCLLARSGAGRTPWATPTRLSAWRPIPATTRSSLGSAVGCEAAANLYAGQMDQALDVDRRPGRAAGTGARRRSGREAPGAARRRADRRGPGDRRGGGDRRPRPRQPVLDRRLARCVRAGLRRRRSDACARRHA